MPEVLLLCLLAFGALLWLLLEIEGYERRIWRLDKPKNYDLTGVIRWFRKGTK